MRMLALTFIVFANGCCAEDTVAETAPAMPLDGDAAAFPPTADIHDRIQNYLARLHEGSMGERLAAVNELICLGESAAPAVPVLLDVARNETEPQLCTLAVRALGEMDGAASAGESALLQIAVNSQAIPGARAAAVEALLRIAPASEIVRRTILNLTIDRQPLVRHATLRALFVLVLSDQSKPSVPAITQSPPPPPTAVGAKVQSSPPPQPAPLELLATAARSEADCEVAGAILVALGATGSNPLGAALRQGSPRVRLCAALSLGRMRTQTQKARVEALLQTAYRTELVPAVRMAIARQLAAFKPNSAAGLGLLAEELSSDLDQGGPKGAKQTTPPAADDGNLMWTCWPPERSAETLLFEAGAPGLPVLRTALTGPSPQSRAAALRVLERWLANPQSPCAPKTAQLAVELAQALRVNHDDLRLRCVELIERLGADARPARAALEALNQPASSPALRRAAQLALLSTACVSGDNFCRSPLSTLPVPELTRLLESNSARETRIDAVEALRFQPGDEAAANALLASLNDPDALLRRAAARALGAFGTRAAPAVPILREWLSAEQKSREAALLALVQIGLVDAGAREAVINALQRGTGLAEEQAKKALAKMLQADPGGVLRNTVEYVDDPDPGVSARALNLIAALNGWPADAPDSALSKVLSAARSADNFVAAAALEVLGTIPLEDHSDVRRLLDEEARQSLFAARRRAAVQALIHALKRNPDLAATQAVETLCGMLADPDDELGALAAAGLAQCGARASGRLLFLASSTSERPRAAYRAGMILARENWNASDLLPILRQRMQHGSARAERARAARVLCAFARQNPALQPELAALLTACDRETAGDAAAELYAETLSTEARAALSNLRHYRAPAVGITAALLLETHFEEN